MLKKALRGKNKKEVKASVTFMGTEKLLSVGDTVILSDFANFSGKYIIDNLNINLFSYEITADMHKNYGNGGRGMIRYGTVTSIFPDKGTIKVTFEDLNIPSAEIPDFTRRTEKNKKVTQCLKIGESGICIFPENSFSGFI